MINCDWYIKYNIIKIVSITMIDLGENNVI